MNPLFSVILPTYNRAYILWRAIQSILAQKETSWELIVVNDGSTDATDRLLEEFQDPRIRSVKTGNQGPSAARNLGIRLACAPYIAYLDSDNTWHPEFLAAMYEAIQENTEGLLWYCGQHTNIWQRRSDGTWLLDHQSEEPRAQYTIEEALTIKGADTNCMVHEKGVWGSIGGWDEECWFLEDWDFFMRCLLRYPLAVFWVPKILVEYRQVHGKGSDGLCAAVIDDKTANHARWQYLIEKWSDLHPGFAVTAQQLKAKLL